MAKLTARDYKKPQRRAFDLAPERGALLGQFRLQTIDATLQAPLRHGMFGPQLIALGDRLVHGKRRLEPRPPFRQAQGAAPKGRQNQHHDEPGDQEPRHEIHCLLDQFGSPELAKSRPTSHEP